jgi:hypothetical protein
MALVNNLAPTPRPLFSDLRILKDFKSFVFGSADCKGVTGAFCESADSKRVTVEMRLEGVAPVVLRHAPSIRITI